MLINCPECDNRISDKAIFCPQCGLPLSSIPSAETKPKKTASRASNKPMRLKSGYGQIHKLSGNRRNPYAAYPPTQDYQSDGKPVRRKAIGYYATYQEALDALSEYNRNPYDVDNRNLKFSEVYELFMKEKFNGKKQYSKATEYSYTCPYNNCKSLHNVVFRNLKTEHFQKILDDCPLKHASLELLVNLFNQMSRYALSHDIIDKDYAQFARISIADDDEHGVPFSEAELRVLWANTDDPTVRMILIMCYSGFRISAYKDIKIVDGCFDGGVKNANSKRLVPIHNAISQWSKEIVGLNSDAIRYRMTKTLESLSIQKHTPHDCRHTFSWLLTSAKVDDYTRHVLMGHKIDGDVETKVYTHKTLDELRESINKCRVYVQQ